MNEKSIGQPESQSTDSKGSSTSSPTPRNFENWIEAYISHVEPTSESPLNFHFWVAVWTIAGALRRRVFIDQLNFTWFPNFYIALIAPAGIVSKLTTMAIGERMLRKVDGVFFGPQSVTWQKLLEEMSENTQDVTWKIGDDKYKTVDYSACSLAIAEYGTFLKFDDKEMNNVLIPLWDGADIPFSHSTIKRGENKIDNPCLNMIGCTTPTWMNQHFPIESIGGGLTSRFVYIYGDAKTRYIAYPSQRRAKADYRAEEDLLIEDLQSISKLSGEYVLSPRALEWGEAWYRSHWDHEDQELADPRFQGYRSRKQSHIHKLALILSAARSNERVITTAVLAEAAALITDLEPQLKRVLGFIGTTQESRHTDTILRIVRQYGMISHVELWKQVQSFIDRKTFDNILKTLLKTSGELVVVASPSGKPMLAVPKKD